MFFRFLLIILITTNSSFAADQVSLVKKYISNKHLKGKISKLILRLEKSPFQNTSIYTVQKVGSTRGAWKVWINRTGKVAEIPVNRGLKKIFTSLKGPLASIKLKNNDSTEAKVHISTILNIFSTSLQQIECSKVNKRLECSASYKNGPLGGEYVKIVFDKIGPGAKLI